MTATDCLNCALGDCWDCAQNLGEYYDGGCCCGGIPGKPDDDEDDYYDDLGD